MRFLSPFLIFLIFFGHWFHSMAQEKKEGIIRGWVVDKDTQLPVAGASVFIPGTDPLMGAASDFSGQFIITGAVVGRVSLEIRCIGYNTLKLEGLILTSAKELYLEVLLEKGYILPETLIIHSPVDKHEANNIMASVSARSFSIEETYRYAGGLGDPARMAANFAGVMAESPQRNDIIVRGNSPSGLLWRLDGMEIPNPNHFGTIGTTGGPVTILNNNLLTNSDFLSGAFPAEYGNSLAGVFDLKMRRGNSYRTELWGQMGWNGFELGAEGGFTKKNQASYLASYRYTFLELLGALGLIGYMPRYQDATLKIDLPSGKAGEFSLIALAGSSTIDINDSENPPEEWTFSNEGQDIHLETNLRLAGITHRKTIKAKYNFKQFLSVQKSTNKEHTDSFSIAEPVPFRDFYLRSGETKLTAGASVQFRSGNHNFLAGGMADGYHVQFSDSAWDKTAFRVNTLINEWITFIRGYGQWKYFFPSGISISSGLYGQYLIMNQNWTMEPRLGIKWLLNEKNSISAGYGLHSQLLPRPVYFFRTYYPDGRYSLTNINLDFSKSHHWVIGFDHSVNQHFRVKAETYYQHLFNIPVRAGNSLPEYSLLNFGDSFSLREVDSLVNNGLGENKGIELTVERFLYKGYYWLATVSLFDSKYTGSDGTWRNSAFDGEYIFNFLAGYEWPFRINHALGADIKMMYAGGKRYVPVDIERSMESGETIYQWEKAYQNKYEAFFRLDLRLGYRLNLKKSSHRLSVDLQNLTNHQNLLVQRVDPATGAIVNSFQIGFFPMLTWKMEFIL